MNRKLILIALPLLVLLVPAVVFAAAADPSVPLGAALDASIDVWTKDGPWWAAIAVAYVGLRYWLGHQHWLTSTRWLAGLTGAAGVLAAVVAWHFQGAPVGGILTALLAAFTLVQHPVALQPSGPPTSTQAGFAVRPLLFALSFVGLMGLAVLGASCATVKARGAAALGAAIDCEAPELQPLVSELLPLATQYVLSIVSSDGRAVDTSALKKAWSTVKSDQGRCALATAIAVLATPAKAAPGAPAAAALVVDSAALRGAFAAVRAAHGWGDTRTSAGVL